MTSQSERGYRRLPGRPFSAISRDSLWLAEDHLLSVQSNRFLENYRRYYFRDVQAITIQQTAPISPWTYAVGTVAAAFLAPGLFFNLEKTFLWLTGALFLAITLALIALGPTCVCHIQTAVSRDKLGSLRWVRTAERALSILESGIEQVQGVVTGDMAAPVPELSAAGAPAVTPPPLPVLKQPETAWGYEFLFVVLLLDGLHAYLGLAHKGTALNSAGWTILITEVVCIVWLLIRQRRFEVPAGMRVIVIVALIVTAGFAYAVTLLAAVGQQQSTGSLAEHYPGYVPLHITAAAVDVMLAAAGLAMTVRYRRSLRPPPLAASE